MNRADEILCARGLAPSRSKARSLIEEGKVFCAGKLVDKPSRKFPDDADFKLDGETLTLRFVSRAGLKLEGFLENFSVDVSGARVLDAGASTGGFTDCVLSRGARKCCCVDVGIGQLHEKLRIDPRVSNYEKTDVRDLSPEFFNGELFDFICADLSFISLEKVLPALWRLLNRGGKIVCLVKPQFEASPTAMRRSKGVLKDPQMRRAALAKITDFVSDTVPQARLIGVMESPIRGGDGNLEYLVGYENV